MTGAADDAVFQGIAEHEHDKVLGDSEHEKQKGIDVPGISIEEKSLSDDGFIYPTDEERNTLPREPGPLTLNTFTIALIEFSERFGYVSSGACRRRLLDPDALCTLVWMPEYLHKFHS